MHRPANGDIHIGFDMDGVLLDHTDLKLALTQEFGVNIAAAQTHPETLVSLMPKEHYRQLKSKLYGDPIISKQALVMPGAVKLLRSLAEHNIRFTLISRRKEPIWARELLSHYGFAPHHFQDDNIFFVDSPEAKEVIARQVGITHYIDDEEKVLRCLTSVPNRFLMDPFHRVTASDQWTIVRSLDEFGKHILS